MGECCWNGGETDRRDAEEILRAERKREIKDDVKIYIKEPGWVLIPLWKIWSPGKIIGLEDGEGGR